MEMFDALPVASVVNGLYLCMHGGISPEMYEVEDINNKVNRFQEPPSVGMLCDILWSDPCDMEECDPAEVVFEQNVERSCSFKYGVKPVKTLLRRDKLLCLIRAHEVK
jgi:serine/threonine-protein phosphatase 2B catalytic subunit